jgi:nucleotide-binding universal stress UspA family protein
VAELRPGEGPAQAAAEARERRVVAGIDGSEESKAALRWAAGQARLTGATVEAVTAWRQAGIQALPREVAVEEVGQA